MTSHLRPARRAAGVLLAGALVAAASIALAGPASAAVPVGWAGESESVNLTHAFLVLGGIPLLLFIVIAALVYAPSVVRGERIQPGAQPQENQWLGGPRKSVDELAGPDSDSSQAGGSSARW